MLVYPVAVERATSPVVAVMAAFAPRALFSAYPYMHESKGLDNLRYFLDVMTGKPLLLDSGVFSLYGDEEMDRDSLLENLHRYLGLIREVGFDQPFMEYDVQLLLDEGRDLVWDLRRIIQEEGFDDQCVYVWHRGDGEWAWDQLRSKRRISLAGQEWGMKGGGPRVKLCSFIKRIPADRHVHVLGCADEHLIHELGDNVTCDVSTWNALVNYGRGSVGGKKFASIIDGKVVSSQDIHDAVNDKMGLMEMIYKGHPEYSGESFRKDYMMKLAVGMIGYMNHYDNLHEKSFAHG